MQYLVVAKSVKNEVGKSHWYDEDRIVDSVKKPRAKKPIGGPRDNPAPTK